MKEFSRRRFLQVAGATMLVAALPAIGDGKNRKDEKRVRIRPASGRQDVSPAERAFCQHARFATAADAMRAAAARRIAAEIIVV